MDERLVKGAAIGAVAGTAAIAATMAAGAIERGSVWEPVNAISHMVLGNGVAVSKELDPTQTPLGIAGHASAAVSWGILYRLLFGRSRWPGSLLGAAAYTAGVWTVDYRIVPKRFTPGFEKVLSPRGIAAIYVALALGFGAAPLLEKAPRGS